MQHAYWKQIQQASPPFGDIIAIIKYIITNIIIAPITISIIEVEDIG